MKNSKISGSIDFFLENETTPDAALNLYEISFTPHDNTKEFHIESVKNIDSSGENIGSYSEDVKDDFMGKHLIYSFRTNYFQIPKRTTTTTTMVYQNVEIPMISSGSDQDKTLNFTLRIDSDYLTINAFEMSLNTGPNGEFDYNSGILWTITVYAYRNKLSSEKFDVVKSWTFNNCRITNIASYNYDYAKSDVPTTTVSFIWDTVEIGYTVPSLQ